MTQTVRVVARIIARQDRVEALKAVLGALVNPSRSESGCIRYDLCQNQADPTDFTFIEEWESGEQLDAHLASQHLKTVVGQLTGLVAVDPDIRRYNQIR